MKAPKVNSKEKSCCQAIGSGTNQNQQLLYAPEKKENLFHAFMIEIRFITTCQ